MYGDDEDEDKTAQQDSAKSVRTAPGNQHRSTVFPDQDLGMMWRSDRADQESGGEHACMGRNLGPRVAATDPGDVLTYSLDTGDR